MTPLPRLAARSLWNRRGTAALTVFSIAVSVMLLTGIETLRSETRAGFARTISGTDLVVGARSGPLNLLLYAVFRIGEPTANVSWDSYQLVARHADVAWTIPLSLGDSHRGFRVLGTSADYFRLYRYGLRQALEFSAGGPFAQLHEAVLGAEVAQRLGYRINDEITIAHGLGEVSFAAHGDEPFRVAGILAPTGTPVDRTVHVSLEALTAIHEQWQGGAGARTRAPYDDADHGWDGAAEDASEAYPPPAAISAFLVGLRERTAVLRMQRALNEYPREPLTAILPGVALQQLWQVVGMADRALLVIAACVVAAGLLGMLTAILASLRERRREMAILRAVGARPGQVFALLLLEAGLLALAGVALGIAAAHGAIAAATPLLARHFGLFVADAGPGLYDLALGGAVLGAALVAGLVPAWLAYRRTLADGLTIRT